MGNVSSGGEQGAEPLSPCTMKELRQVVADGPQSLVDVQYAGLTIREHFAAMAMQGWLANKARPTIFQPKEDMEYCVAVADALLAALSGGRT